MSKIKKSVTKSTPIGSLPKGNLSALTIEGFKSIRSERKLELSALNILSGANSAGKSSFIHPLLLLKQTLEANYDPGPLLIDGPNVKFTELSQIFSKANVKKELSIGLVQASGARLKLYFDLDEKGQLHIKENVLTTADNRSLVIREDSTKAQLASFLSKEERFPSFLLKEANQIKVIRKRSLLGIELQMKNSGAIGLPLGNSDEITNLIGRNIIHVPGLRGNPERSYKKTAVGNSYTGTFDSYVASIIFDWQEKNDPRLTLLGTQLQRLGLTWKVSTRKIDDTRVELQVGRLPAAAVGGARDLVSIADVGFGVSQVLPVLVALLSAKQGQVVYIEQPETHLHPKAQRALAGIFADAAQRMATVIVETHSLLFVRAIQTLVAEKSLNKNLVKLHWVERDAKGDTNVITADLDDAGAYGEWPQDFESTEMEADLAYITAAETALSNTQHE